MYRKKFEPGRDVSPDNPVPQWNAGWFGLQLGGTLWLLIMALVLVGRSSTAATVFGCFLIPNLFGTWLWFSRVRLSVIAQLGSFCDPRIVLDPGSLHFGPGRTMDGDGLRWLKQRLRDEHVRADPNSRGCPYDFVSRQGASAPKRIS